VHLTISSQVQSNFNAMNAFYKLIVGICFALTLQVCAVVAVDLNPDKPHKPEFKESHKP